MDWPATVPWDGFEAVSVEVMTAVFVWANFVAALLFLVLMAMAVTVSAQRRRFWCAQAGQAVEVEFEEVGLPGLRRPVAVLWCSMFSPPTHVTCDRRCLKADVSTRRALTAPFQRRCP